MNKEFVGTFMMTSYAIADKTDIITSALYGLIWSKCQLSNKNCSMSYTNIAKEMGLNKKTIGRKIKILIELGLIKDISNNKYNFPGVTRKYVIDNKAMTKLYNAYSIDNLSTVKDIDDDSEDILSDSVDILSTSEDNLSTSEDLKSVKLYKELNKEVYKEKESKKSLPSVTNEKKEAIKPEFTEEELVEIEERSAVPW